MAYALCTGVTLLASCIRCVTNYVDASFTLSCSGIDGRYVYVCFSKGSCHLSAALENLGLADIMHIVRLMSLCASGKMTVTAASTDASSGMMIYFFHRHSSCRSAKSSSTERKLEINHKNICKENFPCEDKRFFEAIKFSVSFIILILLDDIKKKAFG